MRSGWAVRAGICTAFFLLNVQARADLQDEIQVYDDSINAPGEFHLELHLNGTPKGRSEAEYPGEFPPNHAIRLTPEFSYGLTRDLEAGLYIPTEKVPGASVYVAGARLRLKWLPVQPQDAHGFFTGVNFELGQVAHRFEQDQRVLEVRPMIGWRSPNWLVAANPAVDIALMGPDKGSSPDFAPSLKVARTVTSWAALGFEYYSDAGDIAGLDPWPQQSRQLFLAADIDSKPWVFNAGIGRGFGDRSDAWTIKFIFEIPLGSTPR